MFALVASSPVRCCVSSAGADCDCTLARCRPASTTLPSRPTGGSDRQRAIGRLLRYPDRLTAAIARDGCGNTAVDNADREHGYSGRDPCSVTTIDDGFIGLA